MSIFIRLRSLQPPFLFTTRLIISCGLKYGKTHTTLLWNVTSAKSRICEIERCRRAPCNQEDNGILASSLDPLLATYVPCHPVFAEIIINNEQTRHASNWKEEYDSSLLVNIFFNWLANVGYHVLDSVFRGPSGLVRGDASLICFSITLRGRDDVSKIPFEIWDCKIAAELIVWIYLSTDSFLCLCRQ